MGNIQKRKEDLTALFEEKSVSERIEAYFGGDESKIDRFRATMMSMAMEPECINWDPRHVVKCGVQSAEIGLSPQKSLGHVYFVAYKGKPELTVGYKGWQTLLERAGKAVKSHPVFYCDEFSMEIDGFDERVKLVPNFSERKEDDVKWIDENLRGVLVSIKDLSTGVIHNKFVHKAKLDQLKGQSPSVKKQKFSPWTLFALEMFMAKAIKYVVSKTAMDEKTSIAVQKEEVLEIAEQRQNLKRGSFVAQELSKEVSKGEENGETEFEFDQRVEESEDIIEAEVIESEDAREGLPF